VHCDLLERAAEFDKICKCVVDLRVRCHEEDNFLRAERTRFIEDGFSMAGKPTSCRKLCCAFHEVGRRLFRILRGCAKLVWTSGCVARGQASCGKTSVHLHRHPRSIWASRSRLKSFRELLLLCILGIYEEPKTTSTTAGHGQSSESACIPRQVALG